MKSALFLATLILISFNSSAQNTFPTSGNAGIGTTTPNANLQINGGYSTDCNTYSGQPALNILWSTPDIVCPAPGPTGTTPDAFRIVRPNYSFPPYSEDPIMVLNGEGNLGIGIAPENLYRLKVQGSTYFNGHSKIKGNLSLLQTNTLHTPSISANNSNKGLNIFANTNAVDGAYIEMYGKDHTDASRKGTIGFISHGTTGEGINFINYDPSTASWRKTMSITNDNKVIIGNLKPTGTFADYKLGVDGSIVCKRAVVQLTNWSDFVFKPDYQLKPLNEIENFIKENGHLPDIPSESEITKVGMDVGEMNKLLLQKIEELTLHLIEIEKVNQSLQEQINSINNK